LLVTDGAALNYSVVECSAAILVECGTALSAVEASGFVSDALSTAGILVVRLGEVLNLINEFFNF
jgi:hypothetical protein